MANRADNDYENVGIESNVEVSQESRLYMDSCISDSEYDFDNYEQNYGNLVDKNNWNGQNIDQLRTCSV